MQEFEDPKDTKYGWFVSTKNGKYLHSTGEIYGTTHDLNGGYSGYFSKLSDAWTAINNYNKVTK